jgi:hypothetical protein
MNARRLMGRPLLKPRAHITTPLRKEGRCASQQKLRDDVADGSNSVIAMMSLYGRSSTESGAISLCRKVPKAAVSNRSKTVALFDHLVGKGE